MGKLKKAIVKFKNVSMAYPYANQKEKSLRNYISKLLANTQHEKKNKFVAIDKINIEFYENDRVALTGSNGAGKTTLLKLISKILTPTNGSIEFYENDIGTVLGEEIGLDNDANAKENVFISLLNLGFDYQRVKELVNPIIEFSGLGSDAERLFGTYSTGMKVRLQASIAIAQKPKILLMDEFIGAADQNFTNKITFEINRMINQTKLFFFASHNIDLIKKFCNREVNLQKGIIIEDKYF